MQRINDRKVYYVLSWGHLVEHHGILRGGRDGTELAVLETQRQTDKSSPSRIVYLMRTTF